MSSSGLIYAVIVGAWAVYLVPTWLRREEELNAARQTERFSTAIKVLAHRDAIERRVSTALDRADTTASEPEVATAAAASATGTKRTSARATKPAPARGRPNTAAARTTARRNALLAKRRRAVSVLLALSIVGMFTTAVVGVNYLWLTGVPGALFVAYAWYLRRDERRRVADRQRRTQHTARTRTATAATNRATAQPQSQPQTKSQPRRAAVGEWTPQPVPRPTYLEAPRTRRASRPLDPRTDLAQNSGRLQPNERDSNTVAAKQPAPRKRRPAPQPQAYEPPRAVNE
jgi:hypothetical protein